MQKKIPMRQCLGCREMKPKRELIRAVKMSLFGYDAESDTTVRATTVPVTLHIRPSGFVADGDTPGQ